MGETHSGSEISSETIEIGKNLSEQRILPIGKVLHTDSEGYFVSESSMDNIVQPWDEPVQALVEKFRAELGDEMHSLYIRGSLVRGTAIEGVSDIDGIVLVKGSPQDIDWS